MVSRAAPKVAAMMPMTTKARASLPPAATTGMTTCDSEVTSICAGSNTRVAPAAMATESSPPSGNPTSTLSRDVPRSLTVQCSSTAPEEKKKTS